MFYVATLQHHTCHICHDQQDMYMELFWLKYLSILLNFKHIEKTTNIIAIEAFAPYVLEI